MISKEAMVYKPYRNPKATLYGIIFTVAFAIPNQHSYLSILRRHTNFHNHAICHYARNAISICVPDIFWQKPKLSIVSSRNQNKLWITKEKNSLQPDS
jgi:hypothetical protein